MQPRIVHRPLTLLMGHSLKMSLAQDRTAEIWRGFMPLRRLIDNAVGTDLYSVQVYDERTDSNTFTPETVFEKWAAVEVSERPANVNQFETLILPSGLYAVFVHKGTQNDFKNTFMAIHDEWLPNSGYVLDDRPHFELLGEKYKNNDPESEEEIWVPVKRVDQK